MFKFPMRWGAWNRQRHSLIQTERGQKFITKNSLTRGGNLLPQKGYVLKELSVNYVGSSRLVVELMTSPPTLKANDVCKQTLAETPKFCKQLKVCGGSNDISYHRKQYLKVQTLQIIIEYISRSRFFGGANDISPHFENKRALTSQETLFQVQTL